MPCENIGKRNTLLHSRQVGKSLKRAENMVGLTLLSCFFNIFGA